MQPGSIQGVCKSTEIKYGYNTIHKLKYVTIVKKYRQ